ncbi:class F sortase [Streptomyces sp. Ru71]|uniref:class F sortase n=1 Tax=Streptomyces sp. Ru71 TaxID=2080746 RepID=UPI000CDD6E37|nr:class F sortase [Streptomyces sp. Ru71]POX50383.1 class F sortase [Streptomyces sp. Ru71]
MAASSPSSPDTAPRPPRRGPRTLATLFWAAVALVAVVGLAGRHDTSPPGAGPRPHAAPAVAATSSSAPGEAGPHLPRSRPTRLLIPAIGVDAPFTDLAIDSTGRLKPPPPDNTNLVGWYAKGPSPGEAGTSVIAGHVDTKTAAAVFAHLDELRKGDVVYVDRADGRRAAFVVDSTQTFDKDDFPSDRVYADTPQAQVRLITCAGSYDRSARDYTQNLVVFGHLA